MNVSKTSKPFLLTLLVIALLGIPLTLFSLQKQQVFQQFAWSTQQSAHVACSTEDGSAIITVTFDNTESTKAINVVANDLQTGTFVNLGTVSPQNEKSAEIDTLQSSLKDGTIVFNLTWTDNSPGTNSVSSTYQAISCSPPSVNYCPTNGQNNQGLCAWDPVDGANGYNVVITETDTGDVIKSESVTQDASQSAFPMTPGKPYQCTVSATNECSVGTPTASASTVCPIPVTPTPSQPVSPSPVCPVGTSTQGVCQWDSVQGATSYKIIVHDITTGQDTTSVIQAPNTQFSFPDNKTDTYECTVTATNVCSSSPPTQSPPSTCTSPTPSISVSPTPVLSVSPTPTPTATPTPTPTPTATPTPTPTPTPRPTATPFPTPTPVVIVRIISQPPQQTVIRTPGQTQTIVQQQPGQTQTVVEQPGVQTQPRTPGPVTPGPTMPPTGNTTPTFILFGTSALLLLAGGLIFFIL